MYVPSPIPEHQIYDVFQNDRYIVMVGVGAGLGECGVGGLGGATVSPSIKRRVYLCLPDSVDETIIFLKEFETIHCPKGHTTLYRYPQTEYTSIINVKISVESATATPAPRFITYHRLLVNHYPAYNDEVILSTMVKNEDAYIRQWVEYHRQFGITRFCIYDNSDSPDTRYHSKEKTSDLYKVLKDHVNAGIVIILHWPYPKFLKDTGVSGQTTQQTHAIHAFNRANYLGLFDIDEYLNPQYDLTKIGDILDDIIGIKGETHDRIGGIYLNCRLFYNISGADESGDGFLDVADCTKISLYQYRKCFVIPENVVTYSVHMPSLSKPFINDIPVVSSRILFNHYFFLNKPTRGRKYTGGQLYVDSSIQRHVRVLRGEGEREDKGSPPTNPISTITDTTDTTDTTETTDISPLT